MKLAVLGAGLMGRAALFDITQRPEVTEAGIFDIDAALASEVATRFGNGKATAKQLDAGDETAVIRALAGYDAVVSCVTYRYNVSLTKAAIAANCHMVDLGGNNDVVREQIAMNAEAEKAGVIVVPDCGLAPGMVSIFAADGISKFDSVKSLKIRVGGLPQSPRPPLNYQMVFSAEGLINEYWEQCVILEGGKKKILPPMTEIESLEFDGIGELEAFYTSGGTSTLPDTYEGKIDFLDYKTIRYPGHCKQFRTMLDIGLASRRPLNVGGEMIEPRAVFKAVLDHNLSFGDLDMVLVRLTLEGLKDGKAKKVVYEIVDRQQSKTSLTAMMRTTAFPAAIIAWMAAAKQISDFGVKPQEVLVNPSVFIPLLKKRNINLVVRES